MSEFSETRKLLVIRHGERLDAVYKDYRSGDWLGNVFDSTENYRPLDERWPDLLPLRNDGLESYVRDPPLTKPGYADAYWMGTSICNEVTILLCWTK